MLCVLMINALSSHKKKNIFWVEKKGILSWVISQKLTFWLYFICVEVLRSIQPNGVMSSAVSLPNHAFTGQA